jgi:hypothetical protein
MLVFYVVGGGVGYFWGTRCFGQFFWLRLGIGKDESLDSIIPLFFGLEQSFLYFDLCLFLDEINTGLEFHDFLFHSIKPSKI